jgi:acetyl esterase/lipase
LPKWVRRNKSKRSARADDLFDTSKRGRYAMLEGMRTISYGRLPDQVGDLYLPRAERPPVICLLHGGFWRMPWGRDHIEPLAIDLKERGFAVWNLEYRRVTAPGLATSSAAAGGWPATLQDVGAGIDHLAVLAADGVSLDLSQITVVGHSAGGHLALWCACRDRGANDYQPVRVSIAAAVGLAPVADLNLAFQLGCGNGAVADFLGGTPAEQPARYRTTSPAAMLPLGVKQLLIHGTPDEDVPIEISRNYARAAAAAGDDVTFLELKSATHMDLVDPVSAAHAALCGWLSRRPYGQ